MSSHWCGMEDGEACLPQMACSLWPRTTVVYVCVHDQLEQCSKKRMEEGDGRYRCAGHSLCCGCECSCQGAKLRKSHQVAVTEPGDQFLHVHVDVKRDLLPLEVAKDKVHSLLDGPSGSVKMVKVRYCGAFAGSRRVTEMRRSHGWRM
jgi:hypothetical protein